MLHRLVLITVIIGEGTHINLCGQGKNEQRSAHFNPKNSRRLLFSDCLTFFSSMRVVLTLTGTAYSGCGRLVVCSVYFLTGSFVQFLFAAVSIEWLCILILMRVVVFLHWEPTEMESTEGVFTGGLVSSGPFIALDDLMSAIVFCRTAALLLFKRSEDEVEVVLPNALFDRGLTSKGIIRHLK